MPRKAHVEERCESILRQSDKPKPPSVLIIGVDSVSRMNLHRQMPKTVETLKKMGAVEMLGFTKVGENTYPNLVPLLSGLTGHEIDQVCRKISEKKFDDCPFIWKNFSAAGYRTFFGEDACWMSTFKYAKSGFKDPPTDYYARTYFVAGDNNIGNNWHMNSYICAGNVFIYQNMLDYVKKIANGFSEDPYFGFFWEASMTHDIFHYTRFADEGYAEFFNHLHEHQLLNNTILVFMSDHGIRFVFKWAFLISTFCE